MNFSNEGIFIAISYLLPGFLINIIISSRLMISGEKGSIEVYRYIFYSLLNIFVVKSIDFIFLSFFSPLITSEFLILFLRNMVNPIILGFLISATFEKLNSNRVNGIKNNWFLTFIDKLLTPMKLDRSSVVPSAWDHIFYNISLDEYGWEQLIITLDDGKEIFGIFSDESFASSHLPNHNIFIQEVFEDDTYKNSLGKSVYLDTRNIKKIELPFRGEPHNVYLKRVEEEEKKND